MKSNIHPNYHPVVVECACGNKFNTNSTYKEDVMKVDICSKCHPHYTGKQKLVDTAGRVEKFNKRYNLD
ncbi:MAG: 50S ribosomal protein L31 [Clostridia bacterium]|nr:50S ribosomal protein L31 [Clostridia bacterium]MBQ9786237.1 50S ribosomal protein L31 [Clostridia bacterium]